MTHQYLHGIKILPYPFRLAPRFLVHRCFQRWNTKAPNISTFFIVIHWNKEIFFGQRIFELIMMRANWLLFTTYIQHTSILWETVEMVYIPRSFIYSYIWNWCGCLKSKIYFLKYEIPLNLYPICIGVWLVTSQLIYFMKFGPRFLSRVFLFLWPNRQNHISLDITLDLFCDA